MPLYAYTAINRSGKEFSAERDTKDRDELQRILRDEGLMLVSAEDVDMKGMGRGALSEVIHLIERMRGVSIFEKMIFARNLSVMIKSGLSMTRSLTAISEETKNERFKIIILGLVDFLNRGKSFGEALSDHRDVFGDLFIHMVQAGELSGKLDQVLLLLARQMKKDYDLRSRVRSALIYPAIIISVLVVIGFLFMTYVVPTLSQTLTELHVELPLSTQIIIFISNLFVQYTVTVVSALIIAGILFYLSIRSETGKPIWDAFTLRVPLIGELLKKMNTARITRTLAYLLSSGVPILRSLEIASSVVGNTGYQKSLMELSREVTQGKAMGQFFHQDQKLYDPLVAEMVSAGEETGKISNMLIEIAVFFEQDISESTKNLSSIIEPFLMITIGVIVGFFALSVFQPIYGSLGVI